VFLGDGGVTLLLDGAEVAEVEAAGGEGMAGRERSGARVSREFAEGYLEETVVVVVESVDLEEGALDREPRARRLYISGDYLDLEDDDEIQDLSSDPLPAATHLDFHHALPFSLAPSSAVGAANRRRLLSCLEGEGRAVHGGKDLCTGEQEAGVLGVGAEEASGGAVLRVLLCAEGQRDGDWESGDEEEEAAAWEVGSCVVPLWRSPVLLPVCLFPLLPLHLPCDFPPPLPPSTPLGGSIGEPPSCYSMNLHKQDLSHDMCLVRVRAHDLRVSRKGGGCRQIFLLRNCSLLGYIYV